MNALDVLFRPYRVNKLNLPNRVVMAPMTRSCAPEGVPTEEMAAYYRRRAEKGVGLILTEATGVERPASVNEPDIPRFYGSAALAGWKRIVDEVHAAGGRIMPQLWHAGAKRSNAFPERFGKAPHESPSGLSLDGEPSGDAMSQADVADTIDAFARAAEDAKRLGFDGVELHGGHSYLINQFFFEHLNRRSDRYGGSSLVERARFACDIVKAIRRQVGRDFPVILRLSQWKPKDIHARIAESPDTFETFLRVFVDAGVDAFDLSQPRFAQPAFPEYDRQLNLAGWAKKLTGLTVITVGAVGLSTDAYASFAGQHAVPQPLDPLLERLERGDFDLVAVGRPLLQDAAWLEKIKQGRSDELKSFTPEALTVLD